MPVTINTMIKPITKTTNSWRRRMVMVLYSWYYLPLSTEEEAWDGRRWLGLPQWRLEDGGRQWWKYLNWVWPEIFDFKFFSWISAPQAPKYSIGAFLNFFENSRRYQLHRRKIYISPVSLISFRKNQKASNFSAVSATPASRVLPILACLPLKMKNKQNFNFQL